MAGAASRGGAGGRRRRRPLSVLPLHRSPSGGVGPRGRLAPARAPPPARGPSYTIPARPPQLGNCGQRTPPPLRRRRRRRRGPGPAAAHAPGLPPSLMLAAPQGRREGGGDRTRRHAPWPCLLRARRRLRRGARTAFFGQEEDLPDPTDQWLSEKTTLDHPAPREGPPSIFAHLGILRKGALENARRKSDRRQECHPVARAWHYHAEPSWLKVWSWMLICTFKKSKQKPRFKKTCKMLSCCSPRLTCK
ncbi:serine/arginine repetitive matrix protein 1-like [Ursus arctos]|uniref:serine/arginine repetitive matrix protein 1-like n=1 Tax=Ursus arctos TaxID=9644 RepID=UPI001CF92715|nr:serine/arginine repetitive matrix protein 1-like [Ursus arctos]